MSRLTRRTPVAVGSTEIDPELLGLLFDQVGEHRTRGFLQLAPMACVPDFGERGVDHGFGEMLRHNSVEVSGLRVAERVDKLSGHSVACVATLTLGYSSVNPSSIARIRETYVSLLRI